MSDQGKEAHLGSVLRYALAAASFGAGVIHFTAIFDHTEHAVVAAFFIVLTLVQVAWASAVVRRPSAGLLKAGAVISAGVVVIWLLSRTAGLPGVPGAEEPEAFGLKDGMASLLEVLLAAGIAAQFVPGAQGLRIASGRLASALAVSVVGVLTAAGLSAPGHGHHDGGGAHAHGGSAAVADHDHGDRDDGHGGEAHGHGDAGTGGDHHAAGGHDAAAHGHGAGQDHHPSSVALAAGTADHAHDAPGHVHDPSHHHAPGHVHDPSHHHAPGHVHDPSHHHERSGHADQAGGHADPGHDHVEGDHHHEGGGHHQEGGGHDHGTGDHHHGGGEPGDTETCTSPIPANQVVTTLQETAQSTIGAGCQLETSSPTTDPRRHSSLRRSPEHLIS